MNVLHESGDNFVSHEQVASHPTKEGEGSGGLGNDKEIDNGVSDTAGGEDPEKCHNLSENPEGGFWRM